MEIISEKEMNVKNLPSNFYTFFPSDDLDENLNFWLRSGEYMIYQIKLENNIFNLYGSFDRSHLIFEDDKNNVLAEIEYDQEFVKYFNKDKKIKDYVKLIERWFEENYC